MLSHGFSLQGATVEDLALLSAFSEALTAEGSPLSDRMLAEMPNADVSVLLDEETADPTLLFVCTGAEASDRAQFKTIVDESLARTLEDGVDRDTLSALAVSGQFGLLLSRESASAGVSFARSCANYWEISDDALAYSRCLLVLGSLDEAVEQGAFDALLRRYLARPACSALVATVPAPGELEAQNEALAQALADKKAAMSDEEIDALVARTADFAQWTADNEQNSQIEEVKAVDDAALTALVGRLREAWSYLLFRGGLSVACTDDAAAIAAAEDGAAALAKRLGEGTAEAVDHVGFLVPYPDSVAVVVEGDMQYNTQVLSLTANVFSVRGDLLAVSAALEVGVLMPESLETCLALYDALAQSPLRVTVGGRAAIDENRGLFDVILTSYSEG